MVARCLRIRFRNRSPVRLAEHSALSRLSQKRSPADHPPVPRLSNGAPRERRQQPLLRAHGRVRSDRRSAARLQRRLSDFSSTAISANSTSWRAWCRTNSTPRVPICRRWCAARWARSASIVGGARRLRRRAGGLRVGGGAGPLPRAAGQSRGGERRRAGPDALREAAGAVDPRRIGASLRGRTGNTRSARTCCGSARAPRFPSNSRR